MAANRSRFDPSLIRRGVIRRPLASRCGIMLDVLTAVATAVDDLPPAEPLWDSQLVGVIAGALVAGLVSWILALQASRAAASQATASRAFERVEMRRESRKAACQAFLAAVRNTHDFSKNYEVDYGVRYGEAHPEDLKRDKEVEGALANLALEVPDDVYATAVRLRDVLSVHVWEWDIAARESAHATDADVEAAEAEMRRAVRDLLANN